MDSHVYGVHLWYELSFFVFPYMNTPIHMWCYDYSDMYVVGGMEVTNYSMCMCLLLTDRAPLGQNARL